jgi:uncharacterized protein YcbK (DUF882 family)
VQDSSAGLSRRRLLGSAALAAAAMLLPVGSQAALRTNATSTRKLVLHNLHTDEELEVTYWAWGVYRPDALAQIDWILRDHRTDEVAAIDRSLLDLLSRLRTELGGERRFEVISGYRSPKTNAMLASTSDAVARNSLHMVGKAIDIHVPGVRLGALRDRAKAMRAGVGGGGGPPTTRNRASSMSMSGACATGRAGYPA